MIRSFLKIALRSMRKNLLYPTVAIGGLTIGISSVFMIALYVQHEISYDKFHERASDIYRIAWFDETPQTRTPHPMAQALVNDFPEVEQAVSLSPLWGSGLTRRTFTFSNPEKKISFEEKNILAVDSTFFSVFSFEFLKGNPEQALRETDGIVITESMAHKYFGEEDPIGKFLLVHGESVLVEVMGVVQDVPSNAHFHFDFLISYVREKAMASPESVYYEWKDFGHYNYILLKPGADYKVVESKIQEWMSKYIPVTKQELESFRERGFGFKLQPVKDIHLHSKLRWELEPNGSIEYVYMMTGAAILLLIIACVNVMNLTTTVATQRAKEIGVRKSLGSQKKLIIIQFLAEAVLTTALAFMLSVLIIDLSLPFFQYLSGISVSLSTLFAGQNIFFILLLFVLVVFLTGGYPAFYLSSIEPNLILKGRFSGSPRGTLIRKSLIVFQYTAAMVLMCASVVIFSQLYYVKNKSLGFDEEQVLVVPLKKRALRQHMDALRNDLLQLPEVKMVSAASNIPGINFNQHPAFSIADPQNRINAAEVLVDFDFIELLNLSLIDGRSFTREIPSDTGLVFVVNEAFVNQLRLLEPVGKEFTWDLHELQVNGKIIGVVKDFHYQSLHQSIQPLLFKIYPAFNYALIKINPGASFEIINTVESVWKKYDHTSDFTFTFLDEQVNRQYQFEEKMATVVSTFTILALIIACFGLFALAVQNFQQRIKEIGIRKVLGASTGILTILLVKDFTKLILLAILIAIPLAWYTLQQWLENFAFRIDINVWMFIASAAGMLLIAWATLTYLTVKITRLNPTETLRNE